MTHIADDLNNYASEYPSSDIRNIFFTKLAQSIKNNQLTLASLTRDLMALKEEERKMLFAPTLKIISPTNTDAAQWIKTLYLALGAKTDKATLTALINGTLTERQQKKLLNSRYELWRRAPFDEMRSKALVHELKGSLGLNKAENKG